MYQQTIELPHESQPFERQQLWTTQMIEFFPPFSLSCVRIFQSAPKHDRKFLRIVPTGKSEKKHLKNDSAMKSNRERLLRWLFGGVWQLSIITGCSKMLSEQFLNSPIRRIESADSADSGRIGKWCFRNPKTRVNKFCDWAGFSRVHSERLTIVKLQNFSPIAEIRDLNLEFFRKKKTFFFEKFVIFLKNLSMGKSRKSHQKMFLRWNQKRSGFSNPFRPPGIVGEVSADTRSSKISIRLIRLSIRLNSPNSPN